MKRIPPITSLILVLLVSILMAGCGADVPKDARQLDTLPAIYPDYTEVTVPANIAPLRFRISDYDGEAVCQMTCGEATLVTEATDGKFLFDERDWHPFLQQSRGQRISVTVYQKAEGGEWVAHKPFGITVAEEDIDSHLAYRLLPPGYEFWMELGIYQRDLTGYEESAVAVNRLTDNNCMNCHSFRMQQPDDMLLHMRSAHGGTYIYHNGKLEKHEGAVNDSVKSLVYPSWHPDGRFVAFSTNTIHQVFHMQDSNRIEVYDEASDVVVYDIEQREALSCPQIFRKDVFETFPTFSPDGKWLYYCAADSVTMPREYRKVKYSLCRIAFDASTRTFGTTVDTLYNARTDGRSAKFPRVSPDGRHLVYTLSDYGNFSIWHHDADLYLYDLKSGETRPLRAANSSDTESYHSWSSNSRWLVFSSRRDDGLYTRPYITYIDAQGKEHKPFVLPQADPDFYTAFMKSYNIPELITGPVSLTPQDFAKEARN